MQHRLVRPLNYSLEYCIEGISLIWWGRDIGWRGRVNYRFIDYCSFHWSMLAPMGWFDLNRSSCGRLNHSVTVASLLQANSNVPAICKHQLFKTQNIIQYRITICSCITVEGNSVTKLNSEVVLIQIHALFCWKVRVHAECDPERLLKPTQVLYCRCTLTGQKWMGNILQCSVDFTPGHASSSCKHVWRRIGSAEAPVHTPWLWWEKGKEALLSWTVTSTCWTG